MPASETKVRAPATIRFQRTSAMLARIIDMAAVGMVVADLDGQLVYANRAFGELLGRGIEATNVLDLIHADDTGAASQQLQRLMRGEASDYRGEHRFAHADGCPLWVMVACSVLKSETTGKPDYLIVQLTSIELQKKAETALSYSESRWNFALESARQGVWDHDLRTDTMFYSRMWRIMRGLPPDTPVPQNHLDAWLSRIHPDDLERLTAVMEQQNETDSDVDALEYRERKADGTYVWILSRGRPVEWDENGKPSRTLGTDTDITHLKTIEMELEAERQRLRVTLDSIADGMIATDSAGLITLMNPAAEHLTGVVSAEAIGRPVSEIFVLHIGVNGESQRCPVQQCLSTGETTHLDDDIVLAGNQGLERDIRCTAAPLKTRSGDAAGAVLVFQDVTQSRTMQRQLAHTANHDDLTGLPNRAAFDRALTGAIAAAQGGQQRHCLLYVDLDRFKPVNDTAGHAAGDALLKQVADTMRGACRSHDLAARIGGDEFAVLLSDCGIEAGKQTANRIVRAVAALQFSWAGRTYRIGASIGLTMIEAQPSSPLGFMGEADAACYAAKGRGRGLAVAFGDI